MLSNKLIKVLLLSTVLNFCQCFSSGKSHFKVVNDSTSWQPVYTRQQYNSVDITDDDNSIQSGENRINKTTHYRVVNFKKPVNPHKPDGPIVHSSQYRVVNFGQKSAKKKSHFKVHSIEKPVNIHGLKKLPVHEPKQSLVHEPQYQFVNSEETEAQPIQSSHYRVVKSEKQNFIPKQKSHYQVYKSEKPSKPNHHQTGVTSSYTSYQDQLTKSNDNYHPYNSHQKEPDNYYNYGVYEEDLKSKDINPNYGIYEENHIEPVESYGSYGSYGNTADNVGYTNGFSYMQPEVINYLTDAISAMKDTKKEYPASEPESNKEFETWATYFTKQDETNGYNSHTKSSNGEICKYAGYNGSATYAVEDYKLLDSNNSQFLKYNRECDDYYRSHTTDQGTNYHDSVNSVSLADNFVANDYASNGKVVRVRYNKEELIHPIRLVHQPRKTYDSLRGVFRPVSSTRTRICKKKDHIKKYVKLQPQNRLPPWYHLRQETTPQSNYHKHTPGITAMNKHSYSGYYTKRKPTYEYSYKYEKLHKYEDVIRDDERKKVLSLLKHFFFFFFIIIILPVILVAAIQFFFIIFNFPALQFILIINFPDLFDPFPFPLKSSGLEREACEEMVICELYQTFQQVPMIKKVFNYFGYTFDQPRYAPTIKIAKSMNPCSESFNHCSLLKHIPFLSRIYA